MKIASIQKILGVEADGQWGPKSQAALDALVNGWRTVKASSFADPADIAAFKRCKATGKTDQQCFKVGDNGIGKWGANTAQEHTPMAAIPRDIWTREGKKGGAVLAVRHNGKTVQGILGDTLPSTANIKNGAGIDLNPAFAKRLGLRPPFMVTVEWRWV